MVFWNGCRTLQRKNLGKDRGRRKTHGKKNCGCPRQLAERGPSGGCTPAVVHPENFSHAYGQRTVKRDALCVPLRRDGLCVCVKRVPFLRHKHRLRCCGPVAVFFWCRLAFSNGCRADFSVPTFSVCLSV